MSRFHRKKIFFIILGFFLSFIVLELGLRATGFVLRQADVFGARQVHAQAKAAHVVRILCLGPCYTVGVGVAPEHAYPSYLQGILEERYPDMAFEVVSGAARARNLSHFTNSLDLLVLRYEPDIIIFNVNDRMDLYNENILLAAQGAFTFWGRMKVAAGSFLNRSRAYRVVKLFFVSKEMRVSKDMGEEVSFDRAQTGGREGFYGARIRDIRKKLEEGKADVSDVVNLSRTLAAQGLYEEALPHILDALKKEPANSHYYADLFWCYIALGDYPAALRTQKEGAATDTFFPAAKKRIEDAFAQLKSDPHETLYHLILSNNYALLGEYEKAAGLLETYLPTRPHFVDYFSRLDFYKTVVNAGPSGVVHPRDKSGLGTGAAEYFYREKMKPWHFVVSVRDFLSSEGMLKDPQSLSGYGFFKKMVSFNLEEIRKSSRKNNFRFLLENMAVTFDQIMTIREACAQFDIPLVDMYEVFQRVPDQKTLFHPRQLLRLSEKGNEVWARAIADSLVEYGLLPGHEKTKSTGTWDDLFFCETGPNAWVVLTPDWKMIVSRSACRLYRYREDLLQERDLSLEKPDVVYELMQQLQVWRKIRASVQRESKAVVLDEEAKERLRAEGYW